MQSIYKVDQEVSDELAYNNNYFQLLINNNYYYLLEVDHSFGHLYLLRMFILFIILLTNISIFLYML